MWTDYARCPFGSERHQSPGAVTAAGDLLSDDEGDLVAGDGLICQTEFLSLLDHQQS